MVIPNRKPFQGILNILRFNWHFYVIAVLLAIVLSIAGQMTNLFMFDIALWAIVYSVVTSTVLSCLIYDFTGFYTLGWLDGMCIGNPKNIININAGFDETSALLQQKFPESKLSVFDFYNPEKHTEVSIKRARKMYPAYPGTVAIETTSVSFDDPSADLVFLIFAAHEIRDANESKAFFRELRRVLKPEGKIVMVEHLRDMPNFLAYTAGVFHFFPKRRWKKVIRESGLYITFEKKLTPFTTAFILEKNGNPT